MHIVVVYNKKAGGAFSATNLRKSFASHGFKDLTFIAVGEGFEKKLLPYVQNKAHIAAVGGDGTVSAVAGLCAGTKAILIPLPGGTLNHFTKDLGVAQTLDEAIANIKHIKPKKIDIASVNNNYFINNASIGLYPASLKEREKLESKFGKWPSAVAASFKALFRFKRFHVQVEGNDIKTPFIFVGNNHYDIDGLGATKRTTLEGGDLTVFVTHSASRLSLLKVLLLALIGKAKSSKEFDVYQTDKLMIQSRHRRFHVSRDGEVDTLAPPLTFQVHPKSLWVIA